MGESTISKIYLHRLNNLRIMVSFLHLVPFCRCIILNGSMVEGKIKADSDIDILIIAKSGRIFTCRAAVLFWATLTGLKRFNSSKNDHAGRFCFNYFLTDRFLVVPHNRGEKVNRYCAENYSKSVLLWGDKNIFSNYMEINAKWMKKYLTNNLNLIANSHNLKLKIQDKESSTQRVFENMLAGKFGSWVEKIFKLIQIKRIKKDPAVKKYPKYIVFNDNELRFHSPK